MKVLKLNRENGDDVFEDTNEEETRGRDRSDRMKPEIRW